MSKELSLMLQDVSGVLAQYEYFFHTTVAYEKLVLCVILA